ncbi:MAG: carboxymuconolactone decarboxylase family protein [Rhodobacteraceae bacterium]|jgi:AhpD family alkylhydroperoxidase|nr:carboxymuconolactone decarboxylase family protein [Paracoccaceae bacterium]
MATVPKPDNPEADARVKAVFDDIRTTRGSDFVGNVWQYLAFDPGLLEEVWRDVKAVMAVPSLIDPKTKEMIYAAVSIANACDYCTHSHLAAARAKGMTMAEQAELIRLVATAGKTNHILNAIRPPIDPAFLA